jgi:hypothetical protein
MDPYVRQRCRQNLHRLHRAARRRLLVHGAVSVTAGAAAVWLLTVTTLGATEPLRWVRAGLVLSALVAVLALVVAVWRAVWPPVASRTRLARTLDRAGGLADTLAAADEALHRPERWPTDTPVRAALVERMLARAARLSEDLSLPAVLPVPRPGLVMSLAVLAALAGAGLQWRAPDLMERGARTLRRPLAPDPGMVTGGLRLAPGPDHVVAGDDLTVAAHDLAGGDEPVVCEVRAGTGMWRPALARPVAVPCAMATQPAPYQRWEAVLHGVQEDVAYRFRRGDRVTSPRQVAVWRPPLLAGLGGRIESPAYTGLPPQDLGRLPAYFEAPAGGVLHLSGRASGPLAAAQLVVGDADTVALAVAADSLSGALPLDGSRTFVVTLLDDRGLVGRGDLTYEVQVIPDRVPVVQLSRPDDDGRLVPGAPLLLQVAADDDYGLDRVDLLLRRGDAGGGSWTADLGGAGARDDGWEPVPLVGADGQPRAHGDASRTSLGRLPVRAVLRPATSAGGVRLDLQLQPADLALVPGDVLELVAEAADNRRPGPPGVSRSAVLRLQVPSSLELLEARDESAAGHRDDLAEMRRRTESLGADLERLRRELLKDPAPDWDRRQELQAAVERQQAMQSELSRIGEQMQRELEALAESRLTSPEIMEQMDRIAELLDQARTEGGTQEMLEQLRQQLQEMSPKELTLSMEELNRGQTDMLRRLDTAMQMLDDLAREQQMEGLTDLLAEMLRKQQELAEASRDQQDGEPGEEPAGEESSEGEGADPHGDNQDQQDTGEPGGEPRQDEGDPSADQQARNEELARRQEALAEEMAALEERLRETLEDLKEQAAEDGEMSAAEQEMQEALEQALQQMQEQQTSDTMSEAGENLQQQMPGEAGEQMQQALSDLAGLYHVMLRSRMAMQMAMRSEQSDQMRDVAASLLELSQRQEQLGVDMPRNLRAVRADDIARRQHLVLQGMIAVRDDLADVAGAAPREVLRMLEQLDGLIDGVGRSLDNIEEGRTHGAREASDRTLGEMNHVVIDLLTQAQMTAQGGGGGSPQQMLSQQLQSMSEEQSGLNALAEQLRQNQGRLSEQTRAGMKRLQQGQQGLAGRARQLAEEQRRLAETGEAGRLLGDLERLAEDMETVAEDVAGGLVTEQTLQRQDRILSRMLDMHNASRERDWARRRESRSADEVFAEQEGRVDVDDGAAGDARRWRPVEEAPPAYRDLVREYFRDIQRLQEQAGRREGVRP